MIDRRLFLASAAAALTAGRTASAQSAWPNKPLRIVVGFSAGSTPDLIARTLAEPLTRLVGQPVVVENKPGASGNIAADIVAKAKDDHTLGVMINVNLTIAKLLNPALAFDPRKDLAPVCLVGTGPLIVALGPKWKDKASIDALKAAGGRLNYGSVGVGSMGHLGMEILSARLGTAPTHVPYPGNPQVVQALAANEIDVGLLPAGLAMPQIAPGVPSLADLGIKDLDIEIWTGLAVASTMPEANRKTLERLVLDIVRTPEVGKQIVTQGWDVAALPGDAFAKRLETETAMLAAIVEKQNIRVN